MIILLATPLRIEVARLGLGVLSMVRMRSESPSSSSSTSGRQHGRQPQADCHLTHVEHNMAATTTRTKPPSTMRNMKGVDWVNGLEGSELLADAALGEEVEEL